MLTATVSNAIASEAPALEQALLAQAFSSFTDAAASLERCYLQLQIEVAALRRQLEETDRNLTESLAENQQIHHRLQQILASLPCGVVVVEGNGTVSLANDEAKVLLGTEEGAEVPASILTAFRRTPAEGCEAQILAHGISRWTAIRQAALRSNETGSTIFIVQDISAIKKLEQEHELVRRRQALADMSTTLAHEIRNPLGSLELFAGLLAGLRLGSEEKVWVRQLQAGLRTLAATVNNVLHFHSQPEPELTPVNLGELLDSLGEFLTPQAEAAKVCLTLQHTMSETWVLGDRHRLEQVIMNLASNAFRFTPPGGVVTISGQISATPEPSTARIQIADSGPGIPLGSAERIFEAGYSTRPGSPGLGLAVCKTIMEQHGGSIAALPRRCGATFQLNLPLERIGA